MPCIIQCRYLVHTYVLLTSHMYVQFEDIQFIICWIFHENDESFKIKSSWQGVKPRLLLTQSDFGYSKFNQKSKTQPIMLTRWRDRKCVVILLEAWRGGCCSTQSLISPILSSSIVIFYQIISSEQQRGQVIEKIICYL